ncbi:PREDICTED: uncharacterized protein LOC106820868 [Priapulus caudatus]|uniref:Uncharacterized protein LOC106820868 n=1 Tax=Priapulus caudatus TaxID=37621 RepID=A0ABM1F927_PRICU|nr:PREDICTED: uncharacterized protein LOC106820868 [Priapulus caudatus]
MRADSFSTCEFGVNESGAYSERAMPSAGLFPFLQSTVCSLDNICKNPYATDSVDSRSVPAAEMLIRRLGPNIANTSVISALGNLPETLDIMFAVTAPLQQAEVINFIENGLRLGDIFKDKEKLIEFLTEESAVLPREVVESLLEAKFNLDEMYEVTGYIDFRGVACNSDRLVQYVKFNKNSPATAKEVSKALCSLNESNLEVVVETLQQYIDVRKISEAAKTLAGALGQYDLGTALEDIGTMLDTVRDMSALSGTAQRLPSMHDITEWVLYFKRFTESIPRLDGTNLDYIFFNRVINDLDRMMGNFSSWLDIKRGFSHINQTLVVLNKQLVKVEDATLNFASLFKDPVNFWEVINSTGRLPDQMVELLWSINIKPEYVLDVVRSAHLSSEERRTFYCKSPGFVNLLTFTDQPLENVQMLARYQDVICEANANGLIDELYTQLDIGLIDEMLEKYNETGKIYQRLDWGSLLNNAQQLIETLNELANKYGHYLEHFAESAFRFRSAARLLTFELPTLVATDEPILVIAQTILEETFSKDDVRLGLVLADLTLDILEQVDDRDLDTQDSLYTGLLGNTSDLHVSHDYPVALNEGSLLKLIQYQPEVLLAAMEVLSDPVIQQKLLQHVGDQVALCGILRNSHVYALPNEELLSSYQMLVCSDEYLEYLEVLLNNSAVIDKFQKLVDLTSKSAKPRANDGFDSPDLLSAIVAKARRLYDHYTNKLPNRSRHLYEMQYLVHRVAANAMANREYTDDEIVKWNQARDQFEKDFGQNMIYWSILAKDIAPILEQSAVWPQIQAVLELLMESATTISSQQQTLLEKNNLFGSIVDNWQVLVSEAAVALRRITEISNDTSKVTKLYQQLRSNPEHVQLQSVLCRSESRVGNRTLAPELWGVRQAMCTLQEVVNPFILLNETGFKDEEFTKLYSKVLAIVHGKAELKYTPGKFPWTELLSKIRIAFAFTWTDEVSGLLDHLMLDVDYSELVDAGTILEKSLATKQLDTDLLKLLITTEMEALDRELENVTEWYDLKAQLLMINVNLKEYVRQISQVEEKGITLSLWTGDISVIDDVIVKSLEVAPEVLDAILSVVINPDEFLTTVLSSDFRNLTEPCQGLNFTRFLLFPDNDEDVEKLQEMVCDNFIMAIIKRSQQQPYVKELMALKRMVENGLPLTVNWTDMIDSYIDYVQTIGQLATRESPLPLNLPTVNETAIQAILDKHLPLLQEQDFFKLQLMKLDNLIPLLDSAVATSNNLAAEQLWKATGEAVKSFNTFAPILLDRLAALANSSSTLETLINSDELEKVLALTQADPAIAGVLLYNALHPPAATLFEQLQNATVREELCENLALFSRYVKLPPNSTVELGSVQRALCINLNYTIILPEIMQSLTTPEIDRLVAALQKPDGSVFPAAVNISAALRNFEQLTKSLHTLSTTPFSFGSNITINTDQWQAVLQQFLNSTINQDVFLQSIVQDQLPMLLKLGLSSLDDDSSAHLLKTMNYAVEVTTSVLGSLTGMDLAAPEGVETQKLVAMLRDLVPISEAVIFTEWNDFHKTYELHRILSSNSLCTDSLENVLLLPPGSELNVRVFVDNVCSFNYTALEGEIAALPPVSTEHYVDKVQELIKVQMDLPQSQISFHLGNLTNNSMWANDSYWTSQVEEFWAQTENDSNVLSDILRDLEPIIQGSLVARKSIHVLDAALDWLNTKLADLETRESFSLSDIFPPGSQLHSLLTNLLPATPEFYTIFQFINNHKLQQAMRQYPGEEFLEKLCTDGLQDILPIPGFSPEQYSNVQTAICQLNYTQLLPELISFFNVDAITLEGDNSGPINVRGTLSKLQQLETHISTLARTHPMFVRDDRWLEEGIWLDTVQQQNLLAEKMVQDPTFWARVFNDYILLSDDRKVIQTVGQFYYVSSVIIDYTTDFLDSLDYKEGVLNLGGLFNDTDQLNAILHSTFDIGPDIVSTVLQSSVRLDKLSDLVSSISAEGVEAVLCSEAFIEEYFILPNTTDASQLKDALCHINTTQLREELTGLFDIQGLVRKLSEEASAVNSIYLAQHVETYFNSSDLLRGAIYRLMNTTSLRYGDLDLVEEYSGSNFSGPSIPITLSLEDQYSLLDALLQQATEQSLTAKRVISVFDTVIDTITSKLANLTTRESFALSDLFPPDSQLYSLVANLLPVMPDVYVLWQSHSLDNKLQQALQQYPGKEFLEKLCTDGLQDILPTPGFSPEQYSNVQTAICQLNYTQLLPELISFFNVDEITNEDFQLPNAWQPFMKYYRLQEMVVSIVQSPPVFIQDDTWMNTTRWQEAVAQSNNILLNITTDPMLLANILDQFLPYVEDTTFGQVVKSYYYVSSVLLDYTNQLLHSLTYKDGAVDIASLFVNATQLQKILQLNFDVGPDISDVFLRSALRIDKISDLVQSLSTEGVEAILCSEASINEYFILPNTTDAGQLKDALCHINATQLKEELAGLFDIQGLIIQLSDAANASKSISLTEQMVNYLSGSDLLRSAIYKLMNSSSLVYNGTQLDGHFTTPYVTELMINNEDLYRMALEALQPIVQQSDEARAFIRNLDTVLDTVDSKLAAVTPHGNLSLSDLLPPDSQLYYLFSKILPVLPEVYSILQSNHLQLQQALQQYPGEEFLEKLCTDGLQDILPTPGFSPEQYSNVQTAICQLNYTQLLAELISFFNFDDLTFLQENNSSPVDILATFTKAQNLQSRVMQLVESPPVFIDDVFFIDIDKWQRALNESEILLQSSAERQALYMAGIADDYLRLLPVDIQGRVESFTRGPVVAFKYITEKLNTLKRENGKVNITALFKNSPKLRKVLDLAIGLAPDVIDTLLKSAVRYDKISKLTSMNVADIETIMCSEASINEYFVLPNTTDAGQLKDALCQINATQLREELTGLFDIQGLIQELEAGPGTVNHQPVQQLVGLLIDYTNVIETMDSILLPFAGNESTFYYGDVDLKQHFAQRTFITSDVQEILRGIEPADLLESTVVLETLLGNTSFYRDLKIYLNSFNIIVDILDEKIINFADNLTLSTLLPEENNARNFLRDVYQLTPQYIDALMAASFNPSALINNTKLQLCKAENELDDMWLFPDHVDPTVLARLLCSTNWTAISIELSLATMWPRVVRELSKLDTDDPVAPLNLTTTVMNIQRVVNVAHLLPGEPVDSVDKFFLFEGNSSEWLRDIQDALFRYAESDHIDNTLLSNLEVLTPLLAQADERILKWLHIYNALNQFAIRELEGIRTTGRLLPFASLYNNSYQGASLLKNLLAIDEVVLTDLFGADVRPQNVALLFVSDDPRQLLCNSSLNEWLHLQSAATTTLDELKGALCSINVTTLRDALLLDVDLSRLIQEIMDIERPDFNASALDWRHLYADIESPSYLVNSIIMGRVPVVMKTDPLAQLFNGSLIKPLLRVALEGLASVQPNETFAVWEALEQRLLGGPSHYPRDIYRYQSVNYFLHQVIGTLRSLEGNGVSLASLKYQSKSVLPYILDSFLETGDRIFTASDFLFMHDADRLSNVPATASAVCNPAYVQQTFTALNHTQLLGALCNNTASWHLALLDLGLSRSEMFYVITRLYANVSDDDLELAVEGATDPELTRRQQEDATRRNEDLWWLTQRLMNLREGMLSSDDLEDRPAHDVADVVIDTLVNELNRIYALNGSAASRWTYPLDTLLSAAKIMEYLNKQLPYLQATDDTSPQLSALLPDIKKAESILEKMSEREYSTVLLTTSINPKEMFYLVQSGEWEEHMCNETEFHYLFFFPKSTDPADVGTIQQMMCRIARYNASILDDLFGMVDMRMLVSEIQRILHARDGNAVPAREIHFDYIKEQLIKLISNVDELSRQSYDSGSIMATISNYILPLLNKADNTTDASAEAFCEAAQMVFGREEWFVQLSHVISQNHLAASIVTELSRALPPLDTLLCQLLSPGASEIQTMITEQIQPMVKRMIEDRSPEEESCSSHTAAFDELRRVLMERAHQGSAPSLLPRVSACWESFWNFTLQELGQLGSVEDIEQICLAGLAEQRKYNSHFVIEESDLLYKLRLQELLIDQLEVLPVLGDIICDMPHLNFSAFYSRSIVDLRIAEITLKVTALSEGNLTGAFSCRESAQYTSRLATLLPSIYRDITDPAVQQRYLTCLQNVGEAQLWSELDTFIEVIATTVPLLQDNAIVQEILKITDPAELQKTLDTISIKLPEYISLASDTPSEFLKDLAMRLGVITSNLKLLLEQGVVIDLSKFDLVDLDISNVVEVVNTVLNETSVGKLADGLQGLMEAFLGLGGIDENSTIIQELRTISRGVKGLKLLRYFVSRTNVSVPLRNLLIKPEELARLMESDPINLSPLVVQTIMNSSLHVNEILLNLGEVKDIACSPIRLHKTLSFEPGTNVTHVSEALCAIDPDKLSSLMTEIIKHLSIGQLVQQFVSLATDEVITNAGYTSEKVATLVESMAEASKDMGAFMSSLNDELSTIDLGDTFKGITDAVERNDPLGPEALKAISEVMCSEGDLSKLEDQFHLVSTAAGSDGLSADHLKEMNGFTTQFCRRMYKDLMLSDGGGVIWSYLKPVLRGKILFAPDTPITRAIIRQANTTFENMVEMVRMARTVGNMRKLSSLKQVAKNLGSLKSALSNPYIGGAMKQSVGVSTDDIMVFLERLSTLELGELNDTVSSLAIMGELVANISHCVTLDRFVGLPSEEDIDYMVKHSIGLKATEKGNILAGVIFDVGKEGKRSKRQTSLPKHIKYKIRMDIDNVPITRQLKNYLWIPGPRDDAADDLRYLRGFIQLQDMIDQAIIKLQTGADVELPAIYTQQLPYPCYEKDVFATYRSALLPMLLAISMGVSVGVMTRNKIMHRRIEQVMRAMGLRATVQWLAWFIVSFVVMFFIVVLVIILLRAGGILRFTNIGILFLIFLDFLLSTIMMSYLVSIFFNKPVLAMLMAIMIYMLSYMPYLIIMSLEKQLPHWGKLVMCLSSTTAFSFCWLYISRFEVQGVGLQWSNMQSSPVPGDETNVTWACWMMLIDAAIYFLLAWYLDNLFPGHGPMQSAWYFPFTTTYWFQMTVQSASKKRSTNKASNGIEMIQRAVSERGAWGRLSTRYCEGWHLPAEAEERYGGKDGELCHTWPEHRSSTRTTTINILSGEYPATEGAAYIHGKDVNSQFNDIRGKLGICPQHDILFDGLSIIEHLEFYGKLKGTMNKKKLDEDIHRMLEATDLWDLQQERVENLSGGMRRRLSVAVAFVGGSRTVILDEPTSGIDPVARRHIWDLISAYKDGRTIVLSTHHLDEADIMSDRVAIIHQGKLLACGSSLYLKSKLGSGYQLTIRKTLEGRGFGTCSNLHNPAGRSAFDVKRVLGLVRRHIANAQLVEDLQQEALLLLPNDDDDVRRYHQLFNALDTNASALCIESYGISGTTLEEVFLTLCEQADEGLPMTGSKNNYQMVRHLRNTDDATESRNLNAQGDLTGKERYTGLLMLVMQLHALLVKRLHHSRRNWKYFLLIFLLPCIFLAVAMGFTVIKPIVGDQPSIVLLPAIYGPRAASFIAYDDAQHGADDADRLLNSLLHPPGVSTSCLNDFPERGAYECEYSGEKGFSLDYMSKEDKAKYAEEKDCSCKSGVQSCPVGATGYVPPRWVTNTSDIIYDLRDMPIGLTEYLLKSHQEFIQKRFGGWTVGDTIDSNKDSIRTRGTVWFDNTGFHSLPSYFNGMTNAILRQKIKDMDADPSEYGITTYNHPLKMHHEQLNRQTLQGRVHDVGIALTILVAFALIPAAFVVFPIEERNNEEAQLQFVYGVSRSMYWFSTFIFDIGCYIVSVALSIVILNVFGLPEYNDRENLGAISLLLLLYGWASIPIVYIMAKVLRDSSAAYVLIFGINMVIGINTMFLVLLLSLFPKIPALVNAHHILQCVFLVCPQYAMAGGLITLIRNQVETDIFERFGLDVYKSPYTMEMLGWNYVALAIQGTVFFLIVILVNGCRCSFGSQHGKEVAIKEDEDVRMERKRVHAGGAEDNLLKLFDLTKVYQNVLGRNVAVNKLCVGIPRGECFGLLGVNGAGKTTTFKMLTGHILPSEGEALLNGTSITDGISNMQNAVGYCPQANALDSYLTCKEMMTFYARLRGLHHDDTKEIIKKLLKRFNLYTQKGKVVKQLSGGNKRKLCAAISLLGDPPLILMDEPTTGMDPQTRRLVWNNINSIIRDNRSVVLTSHSMDECDNLCTRLAIMVNGEFQCLGNPQHLKDRFGDGYTLIVKMKRDHGDVMPIVTFLGGHFAGCVFKNHAFNTLEFSIPKTNRLGLIFDIMELARHNLHVENYSVSQTHLDQVFTSLTRHQTDGLVEEIHAGAMELETGTGAKLAADNSFYMFANPAFDVTSPRESGSYLRRSYVPEEHHYESIPKSTYEQNLQVTSPVVPDLEMDHSLKAEVHSGALAQAELSDVDDTYSEVHEAESPLYARPHYAMEIHSSLENEEDDSVDGGAAAPDVREASVLIPLGEEVSETSIGPPLTDNDDTRDSPRSQQLVEKDAPPTLPTQQWNEEPMSSHPAFTEEPKKEPIYRVKISLSDDEEETEEAAGSVAAEDGYLSDDENTNL